MTTTTHSMNLFTSDVDLNACSESFCCTPETNTILLIPQLKINKQNIDLNILQYSKFQEYRQMHTIMDWDRKQNTGKNPPISDFLWILPVNMFFSGTNKLVPQKDLSSFRDHACYSLSHLVSISICSAHWNID